jgi:hypothetical protein
MTISVPAAYNQQLNAAFFQEFTPENPSQVAVFARVTSIALHCLYTGVLKLDCQNPPMRSYRQIPHHRVVALRMAIQMAAAEDINRITHEIIQEMRENPNGYYSKVFFSAHYRLEEGSFIVAKAFFNKLRANYTLDESGVPNTPFGLVDIVTLQQPTQNTQGMVDYLFKDTNPNVVTQKSDDFFKLLKPIIKKYAKLVDKIIKYSEEKSANPSFRAPANFREKLQNELADPQSCFREVIEASDAHFGLTGDATILLMLGTLMQD